MEKVQIRMVSLVAGLKGRNDQEKLEEIGLQSLETRRNRYDMKQTFKILKGFINNDLQNHNREKIIRSIKHQKLIL